MFQVLSDTQSTSLLIHKLNHGDPSALGELSDQFSPALIGFASRLLHEPFLAGDIVQDVYIRFWQKKTAFDSFEEIKRYLYVSTRNACINQNEKFKVRRRDIADIPEPDGDEAMRKLILSDFLGLMYQIVEDMPDKLQEIFFLSFEEGLRPEEIADKLQLPRQTVKNRKVEVYKLLREGLKHYKTIIPVLAKLFLEQ